MQDTLKSVEKLDTKPKRVFGGKQEGAGRPKDKVVALRKSAALGLLSPAKERKLWLRLLNSPDDNVCFKAFLAWNERAYGKVAQPVDVEGELTLVIDI
jgi:hypothetical protein